MAANQFQVGKVARNRLWSGALAPSPFKAGIVRSISSALPSRRCTGMPPERCIAVISSLQVFGLGSAWVHNRLPVGE